MPIAEPITSEVKLDGSYSAVHHDDVWTWAVQNGFKLTNVSPQGIVFMSKRNDYQQLSQSGHNCAIGLAIYPDGKWEAHYHGSALGHGSEGLASLSQIASNLNQ